MNGESNNKKICEKCGKNYTRYKKFDSGVELYMHDYNKTIGCYKIPMTDYHYTNLHKIKNSVADTDEAVAREK